MGEVRVSVTLSNASDEALARRGRLPQDQVRRYQADALVDTGAVGTVAPLFVTQQLGLMPYDRRVVEFADGRQEPVEVAEPAVVRINGRVTTEELLILGDEVLIGQTVLEKMDLLIDPARHRVIPNPAHPDQPITKIK
jgi:clan AA aspartic protease